MSNPFEQAGRARKLAKLLSASDTIATERGLHPLRDARRIYDEMTAPDFAEIISRAGVNAPSATTMRAFLNELVKRFDVSEAEQVIR